MDVNHISSCGPYAIADVRFILEWTLLLIPVSVLTLKIPLQYAVSEE